MLPKTKTERHSDICKEINALYAIMTVLELDDLKAEEHADER